jgi:hypothetical protein
MTGSLQLIFLITIKEIREVKFSKAETIGDISRVEINSLYYLVEYCAYTVKQNEGVCPNCICHIESECDYMTALTDLKNIKRYVLCMFRNISDSTVMAASSLDESFDG